MRRASLTVSARLVLAVAVPTVALSLIGVRVISDRHDDALRAEQVSRDVEVLDQLIHLRSALFAERVAWEILVRERRPPESMLATSEFGRLVLDDSEPLERATDEALARLDGEDRPFAPTELVEIRASSAEWSGSPDTIRERLEPLTSRTEELMAAYADHVRNSAVELGDSDLIAAGTTFQRSIRLPDDAAEIVAALSDLWAAQPEDRQLMQSAVATQVSRYATTSQIFAASLVEPDGPVAAFWNGPMQVPRSLQSLIDDVEAGVMSTPDRAPHEPPEFGVALLESIGWTIESDQLALIAADEMISVAADVSEAARDAERFTGALVFLAIAVSVAGAVLFGRSIVAPVRRLTDYAESVGNGQLAIDPLPLDGPPEVAVASSAMNDMMGSLSLLEKKSRALANIDLEHPSVHERLPGELGAVLQRSTEVLAASIVEREELRSQLQHDATHDSLTGLGNRASLSVAVAELLEREGERWNAAIIFIDLDGFKPIRNRLGLGRGDVVLQVVAARIAELAPEGATVARLGGDEFLVLLTGAEEVRQAARKAQEMVDALAAPIDVDGQVVRVWACAGVAAVDDAAAPLPGPSDLMQRADLAVHDAKQAGPGTVIEYDTSLGGRIAREHDVEQALQAALQPGADELRVLYQPIVAATSGDLIGVETLVRWQRNGTRVVPDQFVPIAERSGLIVQLDRWVMHTAARQLAAWTEVPLLADVWVSVNVSGRTVVQPSFVSEVRAAIEEHGFAPRRLTLEVTETALVTDLGLAATQLERLRSDGVRVAIDDFGTGFTSIAQLRALPIDELKIDGSFVRHLPDTSDHVFVQMIQDMADLLLMTTVAEGVETAEQVEQLLIIGCDAFQGYHFSKPITATELVRWAEDRHRTATTPDNS